MKLNMGNINRAIRIMIASLIGFLWYLQIITTTLAIILLIVAAVFILTGILGFCPLYKLFGIDTCLKKKSE